MIQQKDKRQMPNIDKAAEENFAAPYRTFVGSIKFCLANCLNFKGRASRSEFWWFWLFLALIGFVVTGRFVGHYYSPIALPLVFLIQAVSVRRMHDIGLSGWAVLNAYAPLVAPLVMHLAAMRLSENYKSIINSGEGERLATEHFALLAMLLLWFFVSSIIWMLRFTRAGKPHRNEYNL